MKTCIKNPFPLPVLIAGLGLILTGRAASQSFTTLHNLSYDDGFSPQAGLIALGNTLYGAAESGGNGGNGTLFAVSTTGASFTTLHVFTATDVNGNNSDGSGPDATLILAGNNLYGTAFDGGTNGNGTVYSYTIGASFTNLYNFSAGNTDASNNYTNSSGANPEVGLVISGNTLYGATLSGGSFGNGTLFKVNTDGTGFMNLHSFTNSSDGAVPGGKLVLSGSILYGTTLLGGNGGGGTVFLLNTNGTGFRTLHSFTATDFMPPNGGPQPPPGYTNSDGVAPSSLILIGNTLYGTAVWGGTNGNGTVFSLTTNGTFTTLHSFAASAGANYTNSEGTHPINFDGLVLSGDTLYGTAYWGGSGGNGTIFSINTNGTGFTSLHSFTAMDANGNNSDGANPYASLALSQNTLYGTATSGGTNGDGYGTVFSISLVQPAGAASFTFTGSMTTNRENHTATLLPNGKVLVAGGITNADTGGADLSSAELFDSGSGKWTATGVMTYERYLHTATLLPDGKVLVAGGAGATGALSSVELYDPSTGNWTLTNSMNAARIAHSATLLPNGKLLIAGGTLDGTTDISSAELYDPATGAWIMTGSMTTNRANHTATLLPNGKVLVVGGASGHHGANAIPGAELYDPLTGVWTPTGAPNTARGSYHTATLLSNGKVLVVAGSVGNSSSTYTATSELYDPTTATWTYTGSLNTGARHGHTATLLPNGTVLMAGGEGGTNDDVLSSAELYDPATGVWTATGYLNTAREWHTATLLPNGQVLMAGGCGPGVGSPAIATAELYNFVLGSPQVTTISLPNGTVGSPYSQQLSAVSGEPPYSWSLISGSLPSGLTLATNGVISGTPTSNGTNNFTVQVTDALSATATQALTLNISPPLQVTTASLPNGTNGTAYSQALAATGGQTPYSWSLISGSLPTGLTLVTNGVISGTPTSNGTNNLTVQVTDALSATATQSLRLTVFGPPSVALQPSNNSLTVPVGSNVTFTVSVVGTGPFSYQWQLNGTNLPSGIITTVAGGRNAGDGSAATNAELDYPGDVAVDAYGNLFIEDSNNSVIRKVGTNGIILTVAGGGTNYPGDGGVATDAELWYPQGVAVDANGNLFIAETGNNLIRKVDTNGIITTVAGGGTNYPGDGRAATNAVLEGPCGVAVDAKGNLFIADTSNNRIRKVGISGIITTVAGNGTSGYSGDGGVATNAELSYPQRVAVDANGNLFIADSDNSRIRVVGTNGIITTVAGNGTSGYSGDGGVATNAVLDGPCGVAVDANGNLFIADYPNNRIRKVGTNGIITTVAGNGYDAGTGYGGYSGDGGAATNAELSFPLGVAVDVNGNLFIADTYNNRIRKVDNNGIITTVAGGGNAGDQGVATNAELSDPQGVAVDANGNLFIADTDNSRIRKVDTNWIISTVAGNGTASYSGDEGTATDAVLHGPCGVAVDFNGNLFIADTDNSRIRKVGANGIITTVAGGGTNYPGDGGVATNAELSYPQGVAVDANGRLFIADTYDNRIRKVDINGIITTVAGGGTNYPGDGGVATEAGLWYPQGVAVDAKGNLFIADSWNNRIRKVDTNGIITTAAGNGTAGYSGDGGVAANAELSYPQGLAVDVNGNLFLADADNNRIRKLDTNGIITTVAGNGTWGYSGDGGPANHAELDSPADVAVDTTGNLFIADSGNNVIRKVLIPGPTLVLNDVGFGNAGAYDVVVSNPYGSVTSSVVILTTTLPPVVLSAPQITVGNTNFAFLLSGPSGSNYVLQVSTNLANWSSVSTSIIPVSGSITFSNAMSDYNRRFYRVYLQ
jgi:uncharacterized repeat protein (TIGR03803 family)